MFTANFVLSFVVFHSAFSLSLFIAGARDPIEARFSDNSPREHLGFFLMVEWMLKQQRVQIMKYSREHLDAL